jgi:hypothetical protein
MVFALLFGRGNGSGRRPAARIVPILHAFLEESITRHTLQSLLIRPELAGRHLLLRIDCKTRPRRQEHNQSGSQKRATRHAESPEPLKLPAGWTFTAVSSPTTGSNLGVRSKRERQRD